MPEDTSKIHQASFLLNVLLTDFNGLNTQYWHCNWYYVTVEIAIYPCFECMIVITAICLCMWYGSKVGKHLFLKNPFFLCDYKESLSHTLSQTNVYCKFVCHKKKLLENLTVTF